MKHSSRGPQLGHPYYIQGCCDTQQSNLELGPSRRAWPKCGQSCKQASESSAPLIQAKLQAELLPEPHLNW